MAMEKILFSEARKIAEKKGLKPGLVKGTDGIQFTKGKNAHVELITWEDFEKHLKKRKLAVYESGGFLKVMKA
ncbi:MAG: hypothetical protein M1144_06165 [Candidatus Thermoplasmatota archaeon]|jgi:hypothetical protein|nr:hypothetical protein [Candidatus Thermoplasmatota archaeon]MCL5984704.1 hypothetical protein [Candidatus Thermoplasmatota archaeon]